MSARALLDEIASAGGRIEARGDRLRLRAPKPLPSELIARIRDAKLALLAEIAGKASPPATECALTNWEEAAEERAGIIEHDGTTPRDWAEGFARLDANRPPAGMPLKRWQAVVDAIRQFLDRWASEAAELGWEAADIFGADADRPEVSWLNSGPLWYGDGARVVEVRSDRMIFETRSGAKQTAFRRPHLRPRLTPWELMRARPTHDQGATL